jgi:subtilisin family serine protease
MGTRADHNKTISKFRGIAISVGLLWVLGLANAVKNGAEVLSMSFDYTAYSPELANAIKYANRNSVVSVASAGNDGDQIMVYPGGLTSVYRRCFYLELGHSVRVY